MIFIVCFVPLGLYLLLLGHINRQSRPVVVSGVLDFIGVLFAVSGFVCFGGPAILTGLYENWRGFWLTGEAPVSRDSLLAQWHFWLFLSALYFVVVVTGCVLLLRQQRKWTSIYNVDAAQVEALLLDACERQGLPATRSGKSILIGTDSQSYVELESFGLLRHVSLRWAPANSPLRVTLEKDLEEQLELAGSPYHETGVWLTILGYGVLVLALFVAAMMLLRVVIQRYW